MMRLLTVPWRSPTWCAGVLISLLVFSGEAFAFDHKDTHPRITDRAVSSSALNAILREQLGMPDGIRTKLAGQFGLPPTILVQLNVSEWLRGGAQFEDEGTCHATQHFHNPMKSFTESGVWDLHFGALLWWIPPPPPPISPDQLVRVAMRPWCLSQIREYLPNVTAIHSAVRSGTCYTDASTTGLEIRNSRNWDGPGAMEDIQFIEFRGREACYRLRRTKLVQGQPQRITYYVVFRQDSPGTWWIYEY